MPDNPISAAQAATLNAQSTAVTNAAGIKIDVPWSVLEHFQLTYTLASGRKLPNLLFVTHMPCLQANIGAVEAVAVVHAVQQAGHHLLGIQNKANPWPEVRAELNKGYEGVVILGGYDVLPAVRLDALPASLRSKVGYSSNDPDQYIVWSDDAYGDRSGDFLADVPVSRIPDAHTAAVMRAALEAKVPAHTEKFFLRNDKRPFAEGMIPVLPSSGKHYVSQPTGPAQVGNGTAGGSAVYVMCHGSDGDGTRFWGENANGCIEAMNLSNLPASETGVVFVGCCWGALTANTNAWNTPAGQTPAARLPGASIPLSYLQAGARAFVGCTGSHYSPTVQPYAYFGGPMHTSFWYHYSSGDAPAVALFKAKLEFIQKMPHGQTSTDGQAVEYKLLRQFTCLGLGW